MPTVLIADDSPTLRRIVSTVLERAGFTVVIAEDGVEAVQGVFRTQPDAVILDVQMPRLSGYVAARLLKDDWQTAEIPVVLLTSLDAASDRYWGKQTGADRFLTKDFEAPELVSAIAEVIQAADAARGGRPPLRPDPVEVGDDEVMARVSELLDRKLFEASVVVRGHPDRRGRARLRGVGGRRPRRPRPDRRLRPGRRLHAGRPADLPHRRPGVLPASSTPSSSAPSRTPPPR